MAGGTGYIAKYPLDEIPAEKINWRNSGDFYTKEHLPIDKVEFYKQNRWGNYKQIDETGKWIKKEDGGYINSYANGGEILDRVSSIDNGTLHSENGGVPIGQNALVEKDEYIYTNKQGKKYVFTSKF